jgi:protoheme IX farnesyltransferase
VDYASKRYKNMKSTLEPLAEAQAISPSRTLPAISGIPAITVLPANPALSSLRGWVAVFAELFKARLTLLVLLTTVVGFYIGSNGPVGRWLLLHAVLGTALVASGAAALNQWWERELDARMRRTQERPLPSGQLQPATVLWVGSGCAVLGLADLAGAVNLLTAALGAASLSIYLFVYTPLKRVTWLNTLVGAIPGALPPVMGWTAARGELGAGGWALFSILALWQLPHFMAIAWIYRDDYARGGFKMLPVIDPDGHDTGRQAFIHALALLPVSVCPFFLHLAGPFYLASSLVLGLAFLWCAFRFERQLTVSKARQLFYMSIVYLPLLLTVLVLDKVK